MNRDLRTTEGRCNVAADRRGNRSGSLRSPVLAVAAAGAGAPPPLEAAWFDVVTAPRRRPAREGDDEVFPGSTGAGSG